MNNSEKSSNTYMDAGERARRIKLILFDVDGVMTDGSLYLADDGQEFKSFNSHDGHGIKMLKSSGVDMGIITGRTSKVVIHRAENLGIEHIYQGVEDKYSAYSELISRLKLSPEETAFMGDDVVDLPVMIRCGLAISVPDAPDIVKERSHYVTERRGGSGAVREVCEFILKSQGNYDEQINKYLQ